jgi:hypothetical protein
MPRLRARGLLASDRIADRLMQRVPKRDLLWQRQQLQ